MKLTFGLVLLSLVLVGCSGSKSSKKVDEATPQVELSDTDEFVENPTDEVTADASEAVAEEPAVAEESSDPEEIQINDEVNPEANDLAEKDANFEPGATLQYTVQKNETLMLIAFKLYGDYGKWKVLANQNINVIKDGATVGEGMVLTYQAPSQEFNWAPNGNPYLIRNGDTLGTISKSVYQTMSKWKLLWDNNRPMIKDPNKIYAGFTLYYVDGREVASEF
jgi:nucleoid-associated protein YgaU